MRDRITLTGLSTRGFHGVFDHERRDGQVFVVDIVVELDTQPAVLSDDVHDTVNYAELARVASARVAGNPVNLIETLAALIVEDIRDVVAQSQVRDRVHSIEVTVHKPQAPLTHDFSDVAVTIRRELS